MSSGRCVRCGRETDVEYGSDGLAYCTSCIFYGMNKQCYRCRMYLPVSELQQYQGQWMCPYCLNDVRDEARRTEERVSRESGAKGSGAEGQGSYASSERCDRCGRELTTVYYLGGRRLCRDCYEELRRDWKGVGGEPSIPPYRMAAKAEGEARKRSLLERIFSEILILLRLRKRKKEPEIVAMRKPVRTAQGRKLPEFAKPQERKPEPITEGPQDKEKKGRKESQAISFSSYAAAQAREEKAETGGKESEKDKGAKEKGDKEKQKKKEKKESFGSFKSD